MEMKATIRALLLLTILVATAHACLWDTDTLDEERSDSPSAIELVTGAFARHGRVLSLEDPGPPAETGGWR